MPPHLSRIGINAYWSSGGGEVRAFESRRVAESADPADLCLIINPVTRSETNKTKGSRWGILGRGGGRELQRSCSCCFVYGQPSNSSQIQPAIPISDSSSARHQLVQHPPPSPPVSGLHVATTCPNCICIQVMCANFTL